MRAGHGLFIDDLIHRCLRVLEMVIEGEKKAAIIFRDIRRYYCEFCGICRSKKSLISTHILSHHQDEVKEKDQKANNGDLKRLNTCEECGVSFRKPAYLKQHMQSHSFQRPFICPVDDCPSSYRRKDHLTRHMLQHRGKLFECPDGGCNIKFAYQGNMTRHMKKFHDGNSPDLERLKEYVCPEPGCGKAFKYPSKLRKHEDFHVKLDTCEAFCLEAGCMKNFSNKKCLQEHIRACHQYIDCDQCGGAKHLKKNIKRHLRMHEGIISSKRIKCSYEGCLLTFSTTSNLNQHVKAVHLELKPFACCYSGCGMRFAFKHVRDKHEKSGCHLYTAGDFEELDERFRSRLRSGRKRSYPSIETLIRKRVIPLCESDQFILSQDHA